MQKRWMQQKMGQGQGPTKDKDQDPTKDEDSYPRKDEDLDPRKEKASHPTKDEGPDSQTVCVLVVLLSFIVQSVTCLDIYPVELPLEDQQSCRG